MRKEWRAKKKAEENAKKAEEEERKRNGIKSPEPEPAQGGPIIPPAAAALLQQQQQQHSNTAAQLIYRPLTDGPGSMQGMATSMPISTTGQRPESANPFAFQPPPLSAHHAYAQHEAPNGNSLYHPYIPLDPHAQASAAMRPSTAPSQFAFYPPYPPPNAAAAVAAANPRPTSSSMFSFQAPEASEAMQSFGNIAGQHNPPSPNHSVSIFGGHGISPGSGSPPTSLAEGARRFSLPQQQPVPPLSSLHGIPEDSQPSFISDTRSPSDPGAHQPSANTPAWMEPPNGGGRSASTPVPPQWLDVNSQRTGSTAPTPQSDWTLPGSPPNEHKTEPPSIF